jgi:hypothetical protein
LQNEYELYLFLEIKKITAFGLGGERALLFCVGVERFELSTSRTRTVRSTGLSHTPVVKRANYTIALCFGKLWVEQYFLAVQVKQARHTVIILADDKACRHSFCHFVRNGCFELLRVDRFHIQYS